jgi:hypothetical protein
MDAKQVSPLDVLGVVDLCTFDNMRGNPEGGSKIEPLTIPPFTRLVCPVPSCGRQFDPPKYTVDGTVQCPHCGWEDTV